MTYAQLSDKKKNLLSQALRDFDARWDEDFSLLRSEEDGHAYHGSRESIYYALALMIRQAPGDVDRAVRIIHAVLSLQRLCPGQIWHGTFAYGPEQPAPVKTELDIARLTPLARWQGDRLWGRLTAAYRQRLQQCEALQNDVDTAMDQLSAALRDVFPVVWETYDPNWREFIFSSLALILEEYESLLPTQTVRAIDAAAKEGLAGARFRAESDLTPLNTNVKVMHVFFFDAFARRFDDAELAAYADRYAAQFIADYQQHHAVAEFNSPTYNGVVLSYTGMLRTRSRSDVVRRMGEILEAGLWQDLADFYNPAMKTLAGPFSRAYGLTIEGTALPLLMYLGLDAVPAAEEPPFGAETESAGVLCFADVAIPARVQAHFLKKADPPRQVERPFRELAERGEPGKNHSLCTATAWISDRLMLGAMRGSTNTSHQLHAAVIHWRNILGSVSGLRLRRRTADGRLVHLRTVLLDLTAEEGRIFGEVRNETTEPICCCFEFESPAADQGIYTPEAWTVDGLTCQPELIVYGPDGASRPAVLQAERRGANCLWLNTPLSPGEMLGVDLRFTVEDDRTDA